MGIQSLWAQAKFDPWEGTNPSFGPFEAVLSSKVGMLLGLAWAIGFVVLAFFLIEGIVRAGKARRSGYADAYDEAKQSLAWPAVGVVSLSILPVVYAVLAAN